MFCKLFVRKQYENKTLCTFLNIHCFYVTFNFTFCFINKLSYLFYLSLYHGPFSRLCTYLTSEMFKKFTVEENISSTSQIKNSVQRSIITQIVNQYPLLAEAIETILPKKAMLVAKAVDNVQLIVVNNEILFYNQRDGIEIFIRTSAMRINIILIECSFKLLVCLQPYTFIYMYLRMHEIIHVRNICLRNIHYRPILSDFKVATQVPHYDE